MSKSLVFILCFSLLTLPAAVSQHLTSGGTCQRNTAEGAEQISLKDQLEKGLKARRPVEFQFVATVVNMVDNNLLPIDLVQSTFLWARKQAKYKRYPFPYFEQALRERAKDIGIAIP
jgi:hypothetical protein